GVRRRLGVMSQVVTRCEGRMKSEKLLWVFACLAAFVASAGACSQTFPEWSRGRSFSVKVMMNGTSVKGMRVLLTPENESKKSDQMEITSDANGVARFSRVKPGRYYVEAVRLGVTVGPGTVIVSASGTAEEIAVEWPLRPVYSVIGVAGRFQRH